MDDDTSSCGTAPDATEYMQDEEEEVSYSYWSLLGCIKAGSHPNE